MIRDLLNKFNADSLTEIGKHYFTKLAKEQVPDDYVQDVVAKKALSPRALDFAEILETYGIADMLPHEWYDTDTGVYQTSRAYGFVLNCGTLAGNDPNLDDQLRGLFNAGIPDGTCMSTLLYASSELEAQFARYRAQHQSPLLQKVADERIKFYRAGLKRSLRPGYKFPVRDIRLVISFTFDGLYDDSIKDTVLSLQQTISEILKSSRIHNQIMPPDALLNLIRELLCTKMQPIERHEYDNRHSIRKQVAQIDDTLYIDADGMCINDMGVKSLAVGKYPDKFQLHQCNALIGDMLSKASQISYPFVITQNTVFLSQSKENGKLSASALKTAEQVKPGKFTAFFPVFHKKHAEYKMLQNAISNGEGLMLMNHMIHVYYPLGESEAALQEVKSLYKTFGWQIITNKNLQLPSLLYSIPLCHDFSSAKDQKKRNMIKLYTQTNVTNMMPLFGEYKGTGNPILMFLSPCGQIMFYDIFQSDTNYNVAISAESGAGKSFVTNEIVKGYRAIGAKVSIIDVGRSYKDTCEVLGGQYVEFTRKAQICINPFSFIKLKLDDNADYDLTSITKEQLLMLEDLDDQITMLKSIFLVSAGVSEDDSTYQLADSYFEQAIISSLQKHQTSSTYTTVYHELMEMEDDTGVAKSLANSIKTYTTEGIFGRYFEGEANLDINNDLLVLELEELQVKGHLKFIVLLILMLKITQDMYLSPRELRKLCIIDEAWDLMEGGNTGEFIVRGYRRARKYNGSFITITQRIDDYSVNTTTSACYANAAIKIMLKQAMPKTIELDEYTKFLLPKLNSEAGVYSELLIQMNKSTAMCRFMVDEFTQMLYSTKAPDITLLNKIIDIEGLTKVEGLERLLQIRQTYIAQYQRPSNIVTEDLLEFLKVNDYNTLLSVLGIQDAKISA
jgi:conjugal transfer ATP-binding protein TraC